MKSKVFVGSPCTLNTPGFYQISTKNACIHRTRYILIFIISDCSTKTYKSFPISWRNTNVQSRVIFKTFCPILSFGRLNITDICQILWLTKCAINTIPRKFDKVRLPYYRDSIKTSLFSIYRGYHFVILNSNRHFTAYSSHLFGSSYKCIILHFGSILCLHCKRDSYYSKAFKGRKSWTLQTVTRSAELFYSLYLDRDFELVN